MERLTPREQEIMGIVWQHGGDIAEMKLKPYMRTKKDNEYARTTLATFLMKLREKGYISKYKKGRNSFVHAEVTVEEYLHSEMGIMLKQFCQGDREQFKRIVDQVLE